MPADAEGRAEAFEAPDTIRRMLVTTWALLYSLDPGQRRHCQFDLADPGRLDWDFIPKPDRQGIPLARLDAHQRTLAHSMPAELAARQLARVERDGLAGNLYFCWAGAEQRGKPHYCRVQGVRLLIEFDNAIDSGNHIHSVWRDYRNDLGHDLLQEHYQRERVTGHHLTSRLQSSVPDE